MIGVGYLFATAIGFVQIAPRSTTRRAVQSLRRIRRRRPAGHRHQGPRRLRQPRLCRDDRRLVGGRRQDGGEPALRRAGGVLRRLSPRLGPARRPGRRRRVPAPQAIRPGAEPGARWYRARARAFNAPGQRQPLLAWQLADISRRARRAGALLPRPAEGDRPSRPRAGRLLLGRRRRGASPTSTPRWPNGWASTWRASRRAPRRSQEIVAGDGMALIRSVKADPGTTRNAVIDLDLATVDRRGAAGALHAPRFGEPRRRAGAEPHHRAQPHPGRGRLRPNCAASEMRFTRFFNSTPMAIAGRRPAGPHPAHQCAVPVAVLLGRRPRRGRPHACGSTR